MNRILGDLRIFNKLLIIIASSVIGMIVVGSLSMQELHESLFDDRKLKTRHVVETAYSIIAHFGEQEQAGKLSREEAQSMAAEAVKKMRYEEKEYFWINDMHPRMVMHPYKPNLDGKDLSEFKDPAGKKLFVAFVDEVKKNGGGFVEYLWSKPSEDEPVPKISYVKGYPAWGWIVGSGIYWDDVHAIFMRQMKELLLYGGLVLVLLIGLSLMVAGSVVGPIKRLRAVMGEVKETGNLCKRVDISNKDEVGEMAGSFNSLLTSLQDSFTEVRLAADQTTDAAGQLSVITEQTKTGVNDTKLQTEQVATAMTEMSATVQEVANNASMAAEAAQTADENAVSGKQVVATTVDAINQLAHEVQQGAEVIQRLESDAENISTVLEVIRGIADQTNLLALNAAIEAARAGEQGRGFAVVADEVRTLAKRTQDSTEEIHQMIEKLQEGVCDAVDVMASGRNQANVSVEQAAKAGQSLDRITDAVGRISDMNIQIASAVEEQSVVAEEINRNVTSITDVAFQTADGANQTAVASEQLRCLADGLDQKVSRYQV